MQTRICMCAFGGPTCTRRCRAAWNRLNKHKQAKSGTKRGRMSKELNKKARKRKRKTQSEQQCLKFSAVLGAISAKSSILMRPAAMVPMVMSKKTTGFLGFGGRTCHSTPPPDAIETPHRESTKPLLSNFGVSSIGFTGFRDDSENNSIKFCSDLGFIGSWETLKTFHTNFLILPLLFFSLLFFFPSFFTLPSSVHPMVTPPTMVTPPDHLGISSYIGSHQKIVSFSIKFNRIVESFLVGDQ